MFSKYQNNEEGWKQLCVMMGIGVVVSDGPLSTNEIAVANSNSILIGLEFS